MEDEKCVSILKWNKSIDQMTIAARPCSIISVRSAIGRFISRQRARARTPVVDSHNCISFFPPWRVFFLLVRLFIDRRFFPRGHVSRERAAGNRDEFIRGRSERADSSGKRKWRAWRICHWENPRTNKAPAREFSRIDVSLATGRESFCPNGRSTLLRNFWAGLWNLLHGNSDFY